MKKTLILRALTTMLAVLAFICCADAAYAQSGKQKKKTPNTASATQAADGLYLREWLIAGPFPVAGTSAGQPDQATQEKHFKTDDTALLASAATMPPGKASAPWVRHQSKADIIDLDALYEAKDFAHAYATTAITSNEDRDVVFAFGSDDAIKVFLNGKIIHENWIPRGVTPDQDLVPAKLVKGTNILIVKVQDLQQGWGFTARILDSKAKGEKLISAAASGNLDELKALLDAGADPKFKTANGATAVSTARLKGRDEVVQLLNAKGAIDETAASPESLIENEYARLAAKRMPGIALLVAKDGKVIFTKGYGYRNLEEGKLITPTTTFRIGSITKQFVAAAILRLQEQGKISVKDPLSKFIPDFPRGSEVTVHHLLTHTSGIHSFTSKPDFVAKVTSPITEDALVDLIKKETYDFSPGEQFLYNNSGYFLLGHIIRLVTGKSYGDYLRDEFFKPLGMDNTGVYDASLKLPEEAKGYQKENDGYNFKINWDMSWAGGAGALYSNVYDLNTWNEALFAGKVISTQSMDAAFKSVVLNDGTEPVGGKYGYGWGMENYRGVASIGHGGGLHGFSTRIARYPAYNMTVVMLTNVTPTEVMLNPNTIAEFYLWDKMEKQSSYSTANVAEDVTPYVGRYEFRGIGVMTITSEGKNLFAQLTGQPRFPIFASAPGQYFWKVVDAKIKFVKNEKGEVTHGDFTQNGASLSVPKLKDEVIVSIDPALLDHYVGKYDLGSDGPVTVTKENDKLYAQTPKSPRFEAKPLSEKEFTITELNARLIFVREGDAKATKFVLDMGGQKVDAQRME